MAPDHVRCCSPPCPLGPMASSPRCPFHIPMLWLHSQSLHRLFPSGFSRGFACAPVPFLRLHEVDMATCLRRAPHSSLLQGRSAQYARWPSLSTWSSHVAVPMSHLLTSRATAIIFWIVAVHVHVLAVVAFEDTCWGACAQWATVAYATYPTPLVSMAAPWLILLPHIVTFASSGLAGVSSPPTCSPTTSLVACVSMVGLSFSSTSDPDSFELSATSITPAPSARLSPLVCPYSPLPP